MTIDAATLFLIEVVVMTTVALLLFWAWLQNRSVVTLAWWGGALVLEAMGTGLVAFRGVIADWLSINMSNALLIAACGLLWVGARRFNGRSIHPAFPLGVIIWLVACQFPFFYASLQLRAAMFSVLVSSYALLAALEFWRGTEPLASRPFIVLCLVLHSIAFFLNLPAVFLTPTMEGAKLLSGHWFIFVALQGLLHSIIFSFLLLAMAKERVELRYKTASQVDGLTGAFNRRYFVSSAEAALSKAARDGRPITLALFDLDHFKSINDSFGHQAGDDVLMAFRKIATDHLRADDLFGRLGGEEFGLLLPGVDEANGRRVVDRILKAFSAEHHGRAGSVTASAGIAAAGGVAPSFAELFSAADRGLYKAKELGRNRVESVSG